MMSNLKKDELLQKKLVTIQQVKSTVSGQKIQNISTRMLFRNGNQIEYCLIMQRPIQKGQCAYAKVGKSKPKIKNQMPQTSRSKKAQNLYEELMGQLDVEQSQYINRLCKKNQEKMKKNQYSNISQAKQQQFKEVANILNSFSQKSIKKNIKRQPWSKQSKQNISSSSSLNVSSQQNRQKYKHPILLQQKIEDSSISSQSNKYFIDNLDQYITKLRQSQQKAPQSYFQKQKQRLNNCPSQNDRSFRRTVQFPSKSKNSAQIICKERYSQLLDKLHEQIYQKQTLSYKLECKELKMDSMKKIMKQMHNEILGLKRQLKFQREQRKKYSQIAQDFVHRLHQTRTKSKQKHYIPQHIKRNSHIPSSSNLYSNDFNEYLNRTGNTYVNIGYIGKCKQKEEGTTLKKKGMHKYKMSQIQVDGNQSFHASIYYDSY